MSLLVVGSVALDTVRTPHGRIEEGLGGSATYFSVAAGMFRPVRLVAVVGEDFPGRHVRFLVSRGVDVRGLERAAGRTFRWTGEYTGDMNQAETLRTELNVFASFRPKIPDAYRKSRDVFLANIDPDLQAEVLDQMVNPRLVGCDTMNYWIESKRSAVKKLLRRVHFLLVNEAEARQLAGEENLIKAARALLRMGPGAVVVKRGEYGALLFRECSMCWVPAYPLERVRDPTGAGDSFAGGFMGYLSRCRAVGEREMRKALAFGSVLASFCVEGFSLRRLGRVRPEELHARYRTFRELTRF